MKVQNSETGTETAGGGGVGSPFLGVGDQASWNTTSRGCEW